jgi:uncharacterized protein YbjT (DUF2867 family)
LVECSVFGCTRRSRQRSKRGLRAGPLAASTDGLDATFTFARHHYATEEHIRSTGVAFTFLRGSAFLEVLRWIIGDDGGDLGPGQRQPACSGRAG